MIVPSMTHRELMKEIKIDCIAVDRKCSFLADELRRVAIKSRVKSLDRWYEYTTSRRNNWLIFIRHFGKYYQSHLFVWFVGKCGINIIHPQREEGTSNYEFYHYTSHFFKRYNERFLKKDLPVLESFKCFIPRNMDMNCMKRQSLTYGGCFETEITGIITDGVVFGTAEKDVFNLYVTYKTFISNEMVLEFQKNDIQMIEDFKNGKIY